MDIYPIVLRRAILFLALGLLTSGAVAFAGSATWSITGSGDWNVASNWSPATIPNGAADTATINGSFVHSISLSSSTQVNGIVFGSTATSPYTITTSPGLTFTISGAGITNNSPVTQNFVASVSGAFYGVTYFTNSASAGMLTSFTNSGGMFNSSSYGAGTHFFNTSKLITAQRWRSPSKRWERITSTFRRPSPLWPASYPSKASSSKPDSTPSKPLTSVGVTPTR
jgi:hypothetical protein